ncbi:hypothetical protein [Lacipirellula limnantheis]|uniref:Uncharacterized protein n=1 Tax=Lacipirellula limnantheis TaxID=2528024 RepID=A0A517TZW7_9BACT|nr:hypothetical protein [Lacipirellula limnantheis]QDT73930.1 hypothetical protein I41_31220 [Lacipirellula limnantheis]
MLGQGRPITALRAYAPLIALMATAATFVAGSPCALAEIVEARCRFAWGNSSSAAQKWTGSVLLSAGDLADLQPLGVEADEAAALSLAERQVRVTPLVRRAFDGFDVTIRADESATLTVDLRPAPDAPAKPIEFTVGALAKQTQRAPLDELGGFLIVQRTPGDQLRVRLEREHLVFAPQESFKLAVEPQLQDDLASPATLEAKLYRHNSSTVLWQTTATYDPKSNASLPLELAVPQDEGSYRLRIALVRRPEGFASRLAPWDKGSELAGRNIGFVVVDPATRLPRLTSNWETVATIDATSSSWWQRVPQWTQMEKLPGFTTPRPLGNVKPLISAAGNGLVELPPTSPGEDLAWQAYLLPVRDVGEPHAVEVEVPRALRQHLAVSIVEPDAAGRVQTFGRDWGVFSDDRSVETAASPHGVEVHRLVFWPRTKSPAVIIANRSHERGALYGKIRLRRRETAPAPAEPPASTTQSRLAAAYIAAPKFADSFGGSSDFDEEGGVSIAGWHAFLTAANRLAQQLHASGYNGAILAVAADGASLAPVAGLGDSPRFDSGPLGSTGEDPIRKDILEVLLRVFDREGLTLVPAVELAAPLPGLEALAAAGDDNLEISWLGVDGRPWRAHHPSESATAPHYNLLHAGVQRELAMIAERLAERYDAHPAWGGLAFQLHGAGFGVLPGLEWGLDDQTAGMFASQSKLMLPTGGADRFRRRADILLGQGLPAWKTWRTEQTTTFYRSIAQQLASRRPDARLVLCTEDLFAGAGTSQRLRLAVAGRASVDEVIAETGLDLAQLAASPGISVLRPRRLGAEESVDASAADVRINQSSELDQLFASRFSSGEALYDVPLRLRLPSFDAQSPFGAEQTRLSLAAPSTPTGDEALRGLAAALTSRDFAMVAAGSETCPLLDNRAHAEALRVFQQIPAAAGDVRTERRQPITMRIYREAESTTICLINESPWAVTMDIPLAADGAIVWRKLGIEQGVDAAQASADPSLSGTLPEGPKKWAATLPPFGIQGRKFSSRNVKVGVWTPQLGPEAKAALARQVAAYEQRMANLEVERPYSELQNPDFELVGDAGQMLGWQPRIGAAGVVELAAETAPVTGRSLHLKSEDALGVAVQSHLFPIPSTGQVTVRARIRGDGLQPGSQLYAWFEYQSGGVTRQHYVAIGAERPVGAAWSDYEFAVDDLPLASSGQMRIQFHLVGQGEAWIDDVRMFDLRFSKEQRYQISKRLYAAKTALEEGQLMDCQRLIDGYWPRLFVEQAPVASIASKPADATTAPKATQADEQGISDRLRGMVPRILR